MQSSFVPRVKGRETYGTSPVVQWLGLHALTAVAQVQSLVRERRDPASHTVWPKNKTNKRKPNNIKCTPYIQQRVCICMCRVVCSAVSDSLQPLGL